MISPDAPQNHTFDDKFSDLFVRGATWVEYWLQLDDTPIFDASKDAKSVQILHENRCIGGAAVAARTLWNWGLAARLETAFGDDPNAKFARRTVENDWQQATEQGNAQGEIPTLKLANLSERAQMYRVHLCAPQKNAMANHARLEHDFCDETLLIQWRDNRGSRCIEWREASLWLDGERLVFDDVEFRIAPGGVQVLAAALCRAAIEERELEAALPWAQAVVPCG